MLTYLVDGYNLLHAAPEAAWSKALDLETQRQQLISHLRNLIAARKIKVQLIFDGPLPQRSVEKYPGLTIHFAAPSADAHMRKVIAKNQLSRNLVVVTSDRKDIGEYAKVCGLEWITSQECWSLILKKTRIGGTGDKTNQSKKDNPPKGWTPDDDVWLKDAFGE
ncbi:MAG: NYN domain-containing protein [bacterium]|nr:NYN domain-containing protein [bacterium]